MTYDYVCTSCGNAWEAEQRISEPPLTDCPACGKPTAKRQISGGAGFILKGGGWYADGYASKGGDSAKKADKSESSKSESKSKSESGAKSDTASKSDSASKSSSDSSGSTTPSGDKGKAKAAAA